MTYILGVKQRGANAIISDLRVSRRTPDQTWWGANTALKSGKLFDGCMFGRAGNAEVSRDFIVAFKAEIKDYMASVSDLWHRLRQFASA